MALSTLSLALCLSLSLCLPLWLVGLCSVITTQKRQIKHHAYNNKKHTLHNLASHTFLRPFALDGLGLMCLVFLSHNTTDIFYIYIHIMHPSHALAFEARAADAQY